MKKLLFPILMLIVGTFNYVNAQNAEISFPVSGNCNMCKKRIESALDVKGVKDASWNVQTKILAVKYKADKISEDGIKKLVAKAGYDTPGYKADSADYMKLPECCRYREPGSHKH